MTEEDEAFNEIERRSKAKQEAVRAATRQCSSCGGFCKKSGCERANVKVQQRPWAGLTSEEILDMFDDQGVYGSKWLEFARAVEAKLKDKNT